MKLKCLICGSGGWNDSIADVCGQCLADARLGKLVRSMPSRVSLLKWQGGKKDTRNGKWVVRHGDIDGPDRWDTPEEAILSLAAESKQ